MFSKILDGSKKLADKSKDMVDTLKLKSAIDKAEADISKRKLELGALAYRLACEEKVDNVEIMGLCKIIKGYYEEIDSLNEQIIELQTREIVCSFCSTINDVGTQYCSSCGRPLSTSAANKVLCPKCSFANNSGDSFCAKCGTRLPESCANMVAGGATCPACFAINRQGDVFCGKCGTKL